MSRAEHDRAGGTPRLDHISIRCFKILFKACWRTWAMADDRLGGGGQLEYDASVLMEKPDLLRPDADAGMDLGRPHVVATAPAVTDTDVQDAGRWPADVVRDGQRAGCRCYARDELVSAGWPVEQR
jgi:hypothetical protein